MIESRVERINGHVSRWRGRWLLRNKICSRYIDILFQFSDRISKKSTSMMHQVKAIYVENVWLDRKTHLGSEIQRIQRHVSALIYAWKQNIQYITSSRKALKSLKKSRKMAKTKFGKKNVKLFFQWQTFFSSPSWKILLLIPLKMDVHTEKWNVRARMLLCVCVHQASLNILVLSTP